MATEQNSKTEYILKLYLLSVLEDYKHIDHLHKCILIDKKVGENFHNEIITRKNQKEFWETILDFQEKNIGSLAYKFYARISNESLVENFKYLLCSKAEYEKNINELNNKLSSEKKIIEKIKLMRRIKFLTKERAQKEALIVKQLNTTKEDFYYFFKNATNYFNNFDFSLDIDGTLFDKQFLEFVSNFSEITNSISDLKYDLDCAYKMICACFDDDLLKAENFYDILDKIRTNLSYKYGYLDCDEPRKELKNEYRKFKLVSSTTFFKNTAAPKEIKELMDNLSKRYEEIKLIKNTDEYIHACFILTQDFLQIHPYNDGNGRTSKFLFYVLLLKRNILPFTITDSNYLPNCYENRVNTKSYIIGRQKIMSDRVNNQDLIYDFQESIKHRK